MYGLQHWEKQNIMILLDSKLRIQTKKKKKWDTQYRPKPTQPDKCQ